MRHLEIGIVHELLDGEIPSDRLVPIREHLAACGPCRQLIESERELVSGSDELIEMLDEVVEAAPKPVPVVVSTPTKHRRPVAQWSGRLAWAASLVLAVGLGYTAGGGLGSPSTDGAPQAASAERAADPIALDEVESAGAADDDERDAAPSDVGAPALGNSTTALEEDRTDQTQQAAGGQSPPPGQASSAGDLEQQVRPAESPSASVLEDQAFAATEGLADEPNRREAVAPAVQGNRLMQQEDESVARDQVAAAKSVAVARERQFADQEEVTGTPTGVLWVISGMEPIATEMVEGEVHSLYSHPFGAVTLVQRRVGSEFGWRLLVPEEFPADSLAALRTRVK